MIIYMCFNKNDCKSTKYFYYRKILLRYIVTIQVVLLTVALTPVGTFGEDAIRVQKYT